jgi:aldose 1-epimerase
MLKSSRKASVYLLAVSAIIVVVAFISIDGHSLSRAVFAVALFASPGQKQPANPNSIRGESVPGIEIGGQQVVLLHRKPSANASKAEFISATILPGRGMNLFQIEARIPGRGIVPLIASPDLEEASRQLNNGPDDAHGVRSFAFGGAFIAPYPNRIRGKLTDDGKNIVTSWHGKTIKLPAVWKGKANPNAELHAIHGLILDRKADELKLSSFQGGQSITGIIHAGDFDGHWLSKTDLAITVSLTERAVEATIEATNVGAEPEPMGIGWHPYFSIVSGDRRQARLHISATKLAQVNNYDDVFPTGEILPVEGTKYDFTAPGGKPLDDIFLDDNFSHLSRQNGVLQVSLLDPAAKFGLNIEGLSPQIKTVQVYAPPDKAFAAIEEQFNFVDPFNSIWGKLDTGMVTLEPGQSVTWKVRLRLFTPTE